MTAIDDHIQYLRDSRYSEALLSERERLLLTIPVDPLTLTREVTGQWWQSRLNRPDGTERAASSLSQESSHLRRFCRWAMQQGLVDYNAADWLPTVRQKHPATKPVTESDLYRVMRDAPDEMRRMIALAAMAGLRSSEVAVVRWDDIDPGNGVLWVRLSKGEKGRSVPLSSGLLVELGDPSEGFVIGRQMSGKAVSQAIGRYMRSVGVDYTAHKLRARYATRFLAATGDLKAAADALGHADLSSISRYVVASSDTMRRGAEAAGRIG